MILFEIGLGQREALSFLRNHVHDAWPLERLHDVECVQHLGDVVPIDRAEIAEAELFEQHSRRPQILDTLFDVLREVDELLAADEVRCPLDHVLHALAHAHADRAGDDRAEVFVDRADVGRDRHAIVVQHDDDVTARIAGVVEGFVGQAAGHRTVAHNGDDFEFQSFQVASRRHPECRRQRGAGVTGAELIVLAFAAPEKARQPTLLPQRRQPLIAAGQDLPRVALMADVPNDLVVRRIERGAECHGQLDDAEPRADVAAGVRDHVDQPLPHFVGQLLQLVRRELPDVLGIADRL